MSEADNLRKHALECMRLAFGDGTFSREDFMFDQERDIYTCPAGKTLTTMRNVVNDD